MTVITWQMQERFSFPQELGVPADMTTVRITPQWHEERMEESIRLTGIYHIAARVAFTEGEPKETEAVFIDQLDIGETDSYFEYALPLEVDLAKEKVKGDLRLHISDIESAVENGQTIVTWQMNCSYEEVEEQVAIKYTAHSEVKEQVAIEEIAHSKAKEQVAIEETTLSKAKEQVAVENIAPSKAKEQVAVENIAPSKVKEQVAVENIAPSKVKEQVAVENTVRSRVKEQVAIEETVRSMDTQDEIVFEQVPPVHEDDFYKELAEAYTIFQSNLNKIRGQ